MAYDTNASVRPFGIRDKIGYLFGDLANDFTFIFASSYLMKFYTDVLGVSAALVGVLFLVARFVDAFTDVGMGRLVDTLPAGKNGRFRPWLKRMAIPLFIINVLMYLYPAANLPTSLKTVYMFVTYILWGSVCYTAANIPYGSMASVITAEPGERTSLSTFRSMGAMIAGILISVISPLILFRTENGAQIVIPERFTIMAVIFGVCAMICYLLCYNLTTERIQLAPKKAEKGAGFFTLAETLLTNRALLAIIGAALAMLLCQLMAQSMNIYLFTDYFKSATLLSVVSLASFIPMLLMAPIARILSEKYGKKECSIVGVAIAVLGYGALFVVHTTNPIVYIVLMLIASIGMGFFNMVIWAFITDIIDYQEVRTGSRDDGTVYAIYSFSRKAGQALAGGIGGFALSAVGYVSVAAGQPAVQQSQATLDGIYNISTAAPTIGYLVVLLLLIFVYPLGKKEVDKNVAILKERHAQEK
ncbi:MFS transporter [uncultured Ruthenibacterium sp.]|uniref:MFS transporter n=1 Tax=uncultured Ruthenibacterium sp. TaxID=1905347 RepID=UPI00349E68A6